MESKTDGMTQGPDGTMEPWSKFSRTHRGLRYRYVADFNGMTHYATDHKVKLDRIVQHKVVVTLIPENKLALEEEDRSVVSRLYRVKKYKFVNKK